MSTPEQRARWAAAKRAERAALTPEQRAAKRLEADRRYRDAHRQQRQQYDRKRYRRRAEERWSS